MKYSIITIGREHGSGGRLIAQKVSQALGIPLYDKKLIRMIANDSGFSEEYIEQAEKRKSTSFLFNIYFDKANLPMDDQLFLAQANVIKQVAERGPCVIVGRCADQILKDRKDCLNVFIYAPMEEKMARTEQEYGEKPSNMKNYLQKFDKQRAAYYAHFTDETWGAAGHYHAMFNSTLGLDAVSAHIIHMATGKE